MIKIEDATALPLRWQPGVYIATIDEISFIFDEIDSIGLIVAFQTSDKKYAQRIYGYPMDWSDKEPNIGNLLSLNLMSSLRKEPEQIICWLQDLLVGMKIGLELELTEDGLKIVNEFPPEKLEEMKSRYERMHQGLNVEKKDEDIPGVVV